MKILVTGAKGQLGRSVKKIEHAYPDFSIIYTDIEELDICDASAVASYLDQEKPSVIINCAAYTAVDKAEEEEEKAMQLNSYAPGLLGEGAKKINALLVHISTDYVFNGRNYRPYVESDPPDPQSSYGISKLKGEESVREAGCSAFVIRTSWLYSEFGHNFVKTMLRLGKEKQQLNVVSDQTGTPTYATDLAKCILDIISMQKQFAGYNVFHISNQGVTSWYDFALEIMQLGKRNCIVNPVSTPEYPLPAARPYYSLMSKKKLREVCGIGMPHWKEGLIRCMEELIQEESA